MKIAYLVSFNPYKSLTGTEIGARNVAEAMAARGHEITIFCAYADRREVINRAGLRIVSVSHTRRRYLSGIEANRKILQALGQKNGDEFDVIDLFGSGLGWAFGTLGATRSRLVYHAIDLAVLEWAAVERGRIRLLPFYLGLAMSEGRAIRVANLIVAITRGTQSELIKRYPRYGSRMHAVPLPLQTEWFSGGGSQQRDHFLYIAAGQRRQTGVFLRALNELKRRGFPAKGIVLREPRSEFKQMAEELAVDVVFKSNVSSAALREYYASAYAYVLPSKREGQCLPIVEAASQSTPTVSSPIPSVMDFVQDGETGFLVRSEDPAVWADKMYLLGTDSRLVQTLGAKAREKAQRYQAHRVAADLERLYTENE